MTDRGTHHIQFISVTGDNRGRRYAHESDSNGKGSGNLVIDVGPALGGASPPSSSDLQSVSSTAQTHLSASKTVLLSSQNVFIPLYIFTSVKMVKAGT